MGVPRGDIAVDFKVPTDAQLELAGDLFGDLGHAPKTVDVLNLILSTNRHDDNFKRLWLVLAASTVIVPTTSNKISTRWYPVLVSTSGYLSSSHFLSLFFVLYLVTSLFLSLMIMDICT